MDNRELIYREDFTATVFETEVDYKIRSVSELHSSKNGWEVVGTI